MARFPSKYLHFIALAPLALAALAQGCSADGGAPEAEQAPLNPGEGTMNPGLVDPGTGEGLAVGGEQGSGRTCQAETRAAEAIALDIMIMLDSSGSMLDALPTSPTSLLRSTKWDAVRQALELFVQSPDTQDIGIGLQYFPLVKAGVPFTCESNDDCGAEGGPCNSSLCVVDEVQPQQGNTPELSYTRVPDVDPRTCFDDDECQGNEQCRVMLGECVVPPDTLAALPDGAFLNLSPDPLGPRITPLCGVQGDCLGLPGTQCEQVGICEDRANLCSVTIPCPLGSGSCLGLPFACVNQTQCGAESYAVADVPIAVPSDRAALIASLRARQPNGLTPTGPALSGALEQARVWAGENPGRQVVTVLATDGFPTECEPLEAGDIAALASTAAASPEAVKTFVIGVFSDADLGQDGQTTLNALAQAGGTGEAFVINTTRANVADSFLDALNIIRTTAVGCEFRLDPAVALDLDAVNLKLSSGGEQRDLFNVPSAADCGARDEGWYYVRDGAGNPSQINVCPAVCAGFMSGSVRVDLEIGCATRIR